VGRKQHRYGYYKEERRFRDEQRESFEMGPPFPGQHLRHDPVAAGVAQQRPPQLLQRLPSPDAVKDRAEADRAFEALLKSRLPMLVTREGELVKLKSAASRLAQEPESVNVERELGQDQDRTDHQRPRRPDRQPSAAVGGNATSNLTFNDLLNATQSTLIGAEVQAYAGTPPWEMIKAGSFRPLITWGEKPTNKVPNVPTLRDVYGFASAAPWGIAGPKGMDPKLIKVLHDGFRKAMAEPAFVEAVDRYGMEANYKSSEEYARYARTIFEEQKLVVDRLGLKPQ
jgi:hypothetical protein